MSGCVRRTDSLLVLEKTGDEELNTLLWSAGGSCVRTSYMRACACICVWIRECWQLKDREVVLRVLNVSNLARSCCRAALTHVSELQRS
jgi:hypothetical protein